MKSISTTNAAATLGHYAQAIVSNGFVFVSGQLPIDPQNVDAPIGDIEDQTRKTLKNLEEVLKASGSELNKVVKTTIFISDISLWAAANKIYSEVFGEHQPARSAVPVKDLPRGFQIEIEAVATL